MGGRPYKYPFHVMEIGEVVTLTVSVKGRDFRHNMYMAARTLNRRFTSLWLGGNQYEVRRIDGLPNEDELSKARSRSAQGMWDRRRKQA